MSPHQSTESGFTVCQALIVIFVVVMGIGVLFITQGDSDTSYEKPRAQILPDGVITSAVAMSGDMLTIKGDVIGFPRTDGTTGNIRYHFERQEPHKLGGVQTTVSLLLGNMGGIDMDRTQVAITTKKGTYVIPKSGTNVSMDSPNWTISSKSNWLPYQSADADNILEPNEQFGILILFPDSLSPYESFTLTMQPERAISLSLPCNVPMAIQPHMQVYGN